MAKDERKSSIELVIHWFIFSVERGHFSISEASKYIEQILNKQRYLNRTENDSLTQKTNLNCK